MYHSLSPHARGASFLRGQYLPCPSRCATMPLKLDFSSEASLIWSVARRPTGGGICGGWMSSVALSPDGTLLASGSRDGAVQSWQVADGQPLLPPGRQTDAVESMAFSPDGTLLASSSSDGTVRLWQVADGQLLHALNGHAGAVNSLSFSPDGTLLASAGEGGVQLWQVADGSLLHTLETEKPVNSAVFPPDGALLASTAVIDAYAGAIRRGVWLWRVSDWQQVMSLPSVNSLAVFCQSGVSTRPGLMVLTRMLYGISSLARHLENMTRAALPTL